jgi:hypothetical protein
VEESDTSSAETSLEDEGDKGAVEEEPEEELFIEEGPRKHVWCA